MVRSLSRAAHRISVSTLFFTMPSNCVWPSTTTVMGRLKSNTSGESSNVNAPTPRAEARTVLPSRTRSTRPVGNPVANSCRTRGITVGW